MYSFVIGATAFIVRIFDVFSYEYAYLNITTQNAPEKFSICIPPRATTPQFRASYLFSSLALNLIMIIFTLLLLCNVQTATTPSSLTTSNVAEKQRHSNRVNDFRGYLSTRILESRHYRFTNRHCLLHFHLGAAERFGHRTLHAIPDRWRHLCVAWHENYQ